MGVVPVRLVAALMLSVAVAAPAGAAGLCGYEYCWGALAVGPDGARSRSSGLRTAPWAHDLAKQRCGESCDTVEVFYNGCAAIAEAQGGARHLGFGMTGKAAVDSAMADCGAGGAVCRARVWACSK